MATRKQRESGEYQSRRAINKEGTKGPTAWRTRTQTGLYDNDKPGQRVPREVDLKDVRKASQDPGSKSMGYIPANRVPGKNRLGGDARQASFRTAIGEVKNATPTTLSGILTQVNRKVD